MHWRFNICQIRRAQLHREAEELEPLFFLIREFRKASRDAKKERTLVAAAAVAARATARDAGRRIGARAGRERIVLAAESARLRQ